MHLKPFPHHPQAWDQATQPGLTVGQVLEKLQQAIDYGLDPNTRVFVSYAHGLTADCLDLYHAEGDLRGNTGRDGDGLVDTKSMAGVVFASDARKQI